MRRVYDRYVALCLMAFLFIQHIVLADCGSEYRRVGGTIGVQQQTGNDNCYLELSALLEDVSVEDANNAEYKQLQEMKQMNILPALEKYKGNNPVVVAVLDTGIDYQHEDLSQNIWKNKKEIPENGIDDDGNGYIDDVYGWDFSNNDNTICYLDEENTEENQNNDNHGTHCAGLIAAKAGNHIGTAGIAGQGNVKIMIVKVFDKNEGEVNVKKLIAAIRYATAMGADIINTSWSGTLSSEQEVNQLKNAILESGKLFVASAGNYGKNNDNTITYPAYFSDLDNVVVAGSVKEDGVLSDFSNYGQSVHVAADGEYIYSTQAGSKYGYCSGTSMSTAIVTGIASLVYGVKSHVYPKAVKQLLLLSCNPLSIKEDGKNIAGGIIDAEQVVDNIELLLTDEKVPVVYDIQSNYSGDVVFSVLDQGGAGLCSMNYAKGVRDTSYFFHGMKGTKLKKTSFHVNKTGAYTIFLRDYAGNESVKVIKLLVDTKTPVITATQSKNYITLKVTDTDTSVVKAKYAYGRKKLAYFKAGKGENVSLKNSKARIKYNKDKKYITIYAEDQAGNKRVTPFILKRK